MPVNSTSTGTHAPSTQTSKEECRHHQHTRTRSHLRDGGVDIKPLGKHTCHTDHAPEITQIAFDALRNLDMHAPNTFNQTLQSTPAGQEAMTDPRVLDLHRNFHPIRQHCSVHLSDGSCCNRTILELLKVFLPVGTELSNQHFLYVSQETPTKRFHAGSTLQQYITSHCTAHHTTPAPPNDHHAITPSQIATPSQKSQHHLGKENTTCTNTESAIQRRKKTQ